MPAYEIEHLCALTDEQQDKLAASITSIHCQIFSAPKLFVNVRFTDVSSDVTYVGGKRKKRNCIFAKVRHGPSRTKSHYDQLCKAIAESWEEIVGSKGDRILNATFIEGSLVAGWEKGFALPEAGQDMAWMQEHLGDFKKLAENGDEDFRNLLSEMET